MDLRLFARVLSRFKLLVAGGFVVALLLAVLTVAKLPSLAPRTPPLYASNATLLVTQPGFPWGSAIQQYESAGAGQGTTPAGDLGRLTSLANLYVQLANSEIIGRVVAREVPGGKIAATQKYSFSPSYYSTALPVITVTGTAASRTNALATTRAGVNALVGYLKEQQRAAGIDDRQRVIILELQPPRKTSVVNPTKKTLAIAVFLTVMLAVIGLAFVLESLRPQLPEKVVARSEAERLIQSARRSA